MTFTTPKGFAFDRGRNILCNGDFTVKNPHPGEARMTTYQFTITDGDKASSKLDYYCKAERPLPLKF
jgi:hypothetical protein